MSERERLIEIVTREEARHYFAQDWACACGYQFSPTSEDIMNGHRAAAVIDALGIEDYGAWTLRDEDDGHFLRFFRIRALESGLAPTPEPPKPARADTVER